MTLRILILGAAAAALAACAPTPQDAAADNPVVVAPAQADGAAAKPVVVAAGDSGTTVIVQPKATLTRTYQCTGGALVVATSQDGTKATVTYQGQSIPMTQVVSGSGARYQAEKGGFELTSKGDEATLYVAGKPVLTDCKA